MKNEKSKVFDIECGIYMFFLCACNGVFGKSVESIADDEVKSVFKGEMEPTAIRYTFYDGEEDTEI